MTGTNGIITPSKLALWPVAKGRYLALVARRFVHTPPPGPDVRSASFHTVAGGAAPGFSSAYYEHMVDEYGQERVDAALRESNNV